MSLDLEGYAGRTEFPVIDAGTYEFVIKATITPYKNGTGDYLNIDFKVRDDIDQNFAGAHVFEKIFRDKNKPEWFDLTKSGSILVTQKGKEGYKTKFEEVEEFVQYINGITLVATVEKKYDDYLQKEINEIKYLSYRPSTLGHYTGPKVEKSEGVIENNTEHLDIPDSSLPF